MQAGIEPIDPQTAIYSGLPMFQRRGSLSGHSSATLPLSVSRTTTDSGSDSASSSPVTREESSSPPPSPEVRRNSTSSGHLAPCLRDALERRFSEKNLRGGGDSGITPKDLQKGEDVLASGIKNAKLPAEALHQAVLMKQAGRETRRLRAMASVWELKEVEHYRKFLEYVIRRNEDSLQQYEASVADTESLAELLAFRYRAYVEDHVALATSDRQLDVLEAATEFHTAAA
ncbi:hypothetical protein JVT61DRAFT_7070 [Boletus reticuloceps]|uniref:Uncharacterized protein n=1 Tax=Boletus reticuloceps TaxID=495285 RepID=A0A8I2YJP8_9AGAM|nr:hypothetical protein JVT61DRAFT_7070 [Boletus reticuloceps]